jgi:hypothetical protein
MKRMADGTKVHTVYFRQFLLVRLWKTAHRQQSNRRRFSSHRVPDICVSSAFNDTGQHKQCLAEKMNRATKRSFNILKPTGYVMHQQFNIQQLYVLPTLYLCVL